MCDATISKICVRFTLDAQDTGMMIRDADDGTYEVTAHYRRTRETGFPAQEFVSNDGRVYQDDVDGLVGTMLAMCNSDWFHHYIGVRRSWTFLYGGMHHFESRWNITIEYKDGTCSRWEGVNDAPSTLSGMYDILVSFGMPPLKLGFVSFASSFAESDRCDPLERIKAYLALFSEAKPKEQEDEPQDDFDLLAREFIDDVRCYVALYRETVSPSVPLERSVLPDLEELEATDVQEAPRSHMLALLGALTRAGDPVDIATHALETGMLSRWCERLEAIPREEAEEEHRRQEKEQEEIGQLVDEAIRNRIAKRQVFTARDIAGDVAHATTQKASSRIRAFVRSGEVRTVGDEYPRRYQAA